MKITEGNRLKIEGLRKKQDQHAFFLGVARASYLQRRKNLLDSEDVLALGVLEVSYHGNEKFLMDKIAATEQQQLTAGQKALTDAGIDFTKGEHRIRDDGQIQRLVAGNWEDF